MKSCNATRPVCSKDQIPMHSDNQSPRDQLSIRNGAATLDAGDRPFALPGFTPGRGAHAYTVEQVTDAGATAVRASLFPMNPNVKVRPGFSAWPPARSVAVTVWPSWTSSTLHECTTD